MRTVRRVRIVWIAALSIATLFVLELIGGLPASFGADKSSATADVKITKFHLVETKDGKTVWEVWGDRGEVFDKEGIAKVMKVSNPVTVMLYSDQGKLTARSESATVNMRTKDIRLDRNVTAISEQGNSLQTQSLSWSAKDRRVFTRLPVTLIKGGLTSSGVGMEAETDLERVRFLSRVRSHVMPESAGSENKGRPSSRNGVTQ
ncbi:MAG: LPS export ABC transporter periplasmic protein LptC [Candidatus Methylomirabilota bacterium]|nr:MAG: LPS export ABC transporter periplasmic protein LptC [candidate division NC10 bacterium]